MENKLEKLWRFVRNCNVWVASGISLGPRDIAKPSSQPSVALYLQFYWKPVKKRITSENYFGNKIKNKKPETNISPQTDFLLDSNHTWQQFLENVQAKLTENAKRDRMKNETRKGPLFRKQLVCLVVFPRKTEVPWGQRPSLLHSVLLEPQVWLNMLGDGIGKDHMIQIGNKWAWMKIPTVCDLGWGKNSDCGSAILAWGL